MALISFIKSCFVDLLYPVFFHFEITLNQATSERDKACLLHNTPLKLAMLADTVAILKLVSVC